MFSYSPVKDQRFTKTASPTLLTNAAIQERETTFDPFHYEFDAETMIEPFTYFHNGPTESRQKSSELSNVSSHHYSWLPMTPRSLLSSPGESSPNYASPMIHEPVRNSSSASSSVSSNSSYPKMICRHCKSHNMPECLYTSHSMYDENGVLFCPVLKKCHCPTCLRVTHGNLLGDDIDSDDENHLRLPSVSQPWNSPSDVNRQSTTSQIRNNHNNSF